MEQLQRHQLLQNWLQEQIPFQPGQLVSLTGDAGFRQYYRLRQDDQSLIVVDAPPEKENNPAFVAIANAFDQCGVIVPKVLAHNFKSGFLLLTDLGDDVLQPVLTPSNVGQWYHCAIDSLIRLQQCRQVANWPLPTFDGAQSYRFEFELFCDWYLQRLLGLQLTTDELAMLEEVFHLIKMNANQQPQYCLHRDYHSRNLLCLPDFQIGVIDFQDAAFGPVTYDLVSLLRDLYIDWPDEQVKQWVQYYHQQAASAKLIDVDLNRFYHWFDWMGVQRHLKAVGIFARLWLRDGKKRYLEDIPRGLRYLSTVCEQYPALRPFHAFLTTRVIV